MRLLPLLRWRQHRPQYLRLGHCCEIARVKSSTRYSDRRLPDRAWSADGRRRLMNWSWIHRSVAFGSAHWRGPRRVNLTLADTAFLVDADGTRLDTGSDAALKRILDVLTSLM